MLLPARLEHARGPIIDQAVRCVRSACAWRESTFLETLGGTVVARENGFPANLLSPVFLIGELRIGSISDASCLNMGNNYPTQFESHKKQNQGFGSIIGDHNGIEDIRTLLNDPDFIDMLGNLNGEGLQALAEQWWADGQVEKV